MIKKIIIFLIVVEDSIVNDKEDLINTIKILENEYKLLEIKYKKVLNILNIKVNK